MNHEKCVCGGDGKVVVYDDDSRFVRCTGGGGSSCWIGPTYDTETEAWAEWDRVMRAARETQKPDPAATIDRDFRRQAAIAAMHAYIERGDVDDMIADWSWGMADALLATEKGEKDE